jgi:hypothetical protein
MYGTPGPSFSCVVIVDGKVNNFFGNKRMRMKRKMMALSTSGNGRRDPDGSKPEAPGDSSKSFARIATPFYLGY